MKLPKAKRPRPARVAIGRRFMIIHGGHFACGQVHVCTGHPRIIVKGRASRLDLGRLIAFKIPDHRGRELLEHVVPVEWTRPIVRQGKGHLRVVVDNSSKRGSPRFERGDRA